MLVAGIWAGLIGLALTWIMCLIFKVVNIWQHKERKIAGWNLGEKGLKEGGSCPVLEGV